LFASKIPLIIISRNLITLKARPICRQHLNISEKTTELIYFNNLYQEIPDKSYQQILAQTNKINI